MDQLGLLAERQFSACAVALLAGLVTRWSRSWSRLRDRHPGLSCAVAHVHPLKQMSGHHPLDVGWDGVPLARCPYTKKAPSYSSSSRPFFTFTFKLYAYSKDYSGFGILNPPS